MKLTCTEDEYFRGLLKTARTSREDIYRATPDRASRKALLTNASTQTFLQYMRDDQFERSLDPAAFFHKSLDLFRRLYARGGPYYGAKIELHPCLEDFEVPKFAILAHLVIKEPETFGHMRHEVFGLLLDHQLAWPIKFAELVKHIDSLRKLEPTLEISDVMAEVGSDAHTYISRYATLVAIQDRGGLLWLLEQGADIKATLKRCLDLVEGTTAGSQAFASMFRLTLDCIDHLEQEVGIDPEQALNSRRRLVRDAIDLSRRQKVKDVNLWRPMLKELVNVMSDTMDTGRFVRCLRDTLPENRDYRLVKVAAEMDPREFKKCLKQDIPQHERYDLICRAELQHLFTNSEMLNLCGHQFSSDLGL